MYPNRALGMTLSKRSDVMKSGMEIVLTETSGCAANRNGSQSLAPPRPRHGESAACSAEDMVLEFDVDTRHLACDCGWQIRLTKKETAVIDYLLRHAPDAVSVLQLQSDVWHQHPDVQSHRVETNIYRLRQKIEIQPRRPRIVVTTATGYAVTSCLSRRIVAPDAAQ